MPAGRKTRILIVDDSAMMRSLIGAVVRTDEGLEVAGTAGNGEAALLAVETIRPDLILLDVEMPVMDGLVTLRQLRARGHRMPVIMCSALTRRGATVTIEALTGGAADYVTKPTAQSGPEAAIRALALDLIPKIYALVNHVQWRPQPPLPSAPRVPIVLAVPQPYKAQFISPVPTVLAIGVSTGGPAALDVLLPALPKDFPLPVVIVQHMPELFTKLFAERLDKRCGLRVLEASEDDPVAAGTIHIARGNWHMEVHAASHTGQPATLHLNQSEPENHCRPAVDALFRSLAGVYGSGVLAVVLTGMGTDGLAGCRTIRERGGCVLAQDQATSIVWGMPGAVANSGLAHRVLPLNAIVPEILRIASRTHSEARELRRSVM